jgi:Ala-tRNA(Pro) deacylase
MDEQLKEFLAAHGIEYVLHTHPAVFTVAEAELHCRHIPGLSCKNLFLKDDAGRFYLVVLPAAKRLDMKRFRGLIGVGKIRFGTDEELYSVLRLTPGSVSPFGLVNDSDMKAIVYVDEEVWDAAIVSFHPNINTETLELTQEAFRRFFSIRHKPRIEAL